MCGKSLRLAVYCLLSFSLAHLHARPTQQYRQWVRGIFDLPGEIARATNVSQLQPFLESDREFTRMAAARRLGQIEGPRSIPILLDILAKEKSPMGIETAPLVKLEVIRVLGQIGGERSKSALLDILKRYWQQGPRVKEKKGYRFDTDFACVMDAALRTVAAWGNDPNVFEMLQRIALSDDVREFYVHPYGLGQTAWEAYLKSQMKREAIAEDEQSLVYLLDFMNRLRGRSSYSLECIKSLAAFAVLRQHSESALSGLAEKLTKELAEEEGASADGSISERNHELRSQIGCIKRALREKAKLDGLDRNPVSWQDKPQPSPDASK